MTDDDLPTFWRQADALSLKAQRRTLRLNRIQLAGAIVAAIGGAVPWHIGQTDIGAVLILLGFTAAFISQSTLLALKPEDLWYEGRALAESAKTLAWRFAVAADPFPSSMEEPTARDLLVQRLSEVHSAAPHIVVESDDNTFVSHGMTALRAQSFARRQSAYIEGRTREQQKWYASKAIHNQSWARRLQAIIVAAELIALVAAALRIFGGFSVDVAGMLAATVAAAVAWLAIKQHNNLGTAYSIAAAELAKQIEKLRGVEATDWALYAADAEEAISREHTLWLASRTSSISVGDIARPDQQETSGHS